MPKTSRKKKGCLITSAVLFVGIVIGVFGIHSCFRHTFGEIFHEGSSRDHRKLHRFAMEVEPVRLAIETYLATHGHTPPELTDLPKPHPFPFNDSHLTTSEDRIWSYFRYDEEPKIYTLGTSLNWDATLTYRTRHKQGWQYDPGNGDPAWSIDPSR